MIAQAPESADYKGMPVSAIDTGFVDYILPPESIAEKLEEIARGDQNHKGGTQSAGES